MKSIPVAGQGQCHGDNLDCSHLSSLCHPCSSCIKGNLAINGGAERAARCPFAHCQHPRETFLLTSGHFFFYCSVLKILLVLHPHSVCSDYGIGGEPRQSNEAELPSK